MEGTNRRNQNVAEAVKLNDALRVSTQQGAQPRFADMGESQASLVLWQWLP